jgi:hypothetical protein
VAEAAGEQAFERALGTVGVAFDQALLPPFLHGPNVPADDIA